MKKIIKIFLFVLFSFPVSSGYAHDTLLQKSVQYLSWIFPDNYGTQPLAPENEAYIRAIINEMSIKKPIHIRKMNRLALSIYGRNNTFCLLDNYLFVSESFFSELTDSEKRFLIGHELAHLLCNHSFKKMALLDMNPIIAFASCFGTRNTLKKISKISNHRIDQMTAYSYIISTIVGSLLIKNIARLQEFEADHISASMLNNYEGGITFLERIDKINTYNYSTWFNRITATHPAPQKRIKQLQKNYPITRKDTNND